MNDRRSFVCSALAALLATRGSLFSAHSRAAEAEDLMPPLDATNTSDRFPHFLSSPISYRHVKLTDTFWAPRQRSAREVSVAWVTEAHDLAGGLKALKSLPNGYRADASVMNMEAIKFIEAMAALVGLDRDQDIEGLMHAWLKHLLQAQGADGYLQENFPPGLHRPPRRWQNAWWSHEAYATGHYIESAIAFREATGHEAMYSSAIRAADVMVAELLHSDHSYISAHPEIEQALMRLYGETGNEEYVRLCGWLLNQRGRHTRRPSVGRARQDHIPVKDQRTIEGHAVMAAYLFNGVTHYVGATGDAEYRKATLSVWDDFVNHKMYIHGAGGTVSSRIEGYRAEPYCIVPDDVYGESCSVFANFQWAHSLFRLTGDAKYINTAERMLYNAFYASLSLKGDASFYCNVLQVARPTPRSSELATSCCPPNIIKLFGQVGGYFYSVDKAGIYVKHYGASDARVPFNHHAIHLIQETDYPWNGDIVIRVEPTVPVRFALRLRLPDWAKSHALFVNDQPTQGSRNKGWIVVDRLWQAGDHARLKLDMPVERVTMPRQFFEYENKVALQRGPVLYCLEEQDIEGGPVPQNWVAYEKLGAFGRLATLYIHDNARFEPEHRADFLGGVTVLRGEVRELNGENDREKTLRATFIPYGVWNNRTPGAMRVWLGARKVPLVELLAPQEKLGESCTG